MTKSTITDAALEGLLADAHDAYDTYTNASESDDDGGGGTAADCMRGCDQNLKDCLESWGEIAGGEDIDLFDAELEQDAEDQTDGGGGAVGSIDDNPLDVEDSDAGDTGGTDDSEGHDGWSGNLSWSETMAVGGLCTLTYTLCMLSCELEAIGGSGS